MNRVSTTVLKVVILLIGIAVLTICVFGLPNLILSEMKSGADFDYGLIFLGLYIPAIPFFYALSQALRLLRYIDTGRAFTNESTKAFKNIAYCAYLISALFVAGLPYIFHVADKDDAPGVVAIAIIVIGTSFVIGTFSAVMRKLVQNAVAIKSENDLTV